MSPAAPAAIGEPVPTPEPAPAKAGPRVRGPLRTRVSPDVGRIAAAGASVGAAALSSWIIGADGVAALPALGIASSAALLVWAVAAALRARAILVVALVVSIGPLLQLAVWLGSDRSSDPAWGPGIAFVPVAVMGAAFFLLLRGGMDARSVASGMLLAVVIAIVGTAWPLLALFSGYHLARANAGAPLLIPIAVAPVAWILSNAGRVATLNRSTAIVTLRDASYRVLVLAAVVLASTWLGGAAESFARRMLVRTSLEGLANGVGWVVAVALLCSLGWAAFQLPVWLVRLQLRGRFEASAVGESIVFAGLACLGALLLPLYLPSTDAGSNAVIVLAAAAAYGWSRLRFAEPSSAPNAPLWIVILDEIGQEGPHVAAELAADWRVGQVTVLALPSIAERVAGEHLQAAVRARVADALFPRRTAHLEDWDAAQPPTWVSLPVRELYAPPRLWPAILAEKVEAGGHVLVLSKKPREESSDEAAIQDESDDDIPLNVARVVGFRALALTRYVLERLVDAPQVGALWMPRANAPTLRPGLSRSDLHRLGSEIEGGKARILAEVRKRQPTLPPVLTRRILIVALPADAALAEAIARSIDRRQDAAGRRVEAWAMPTSTSHAGGLFFATRFGAVRVSSHIIARLLEEAGTGVDGLLWRLYARTVAAMTDLGDGAEVELVVIETSAGNPVTGLPRTAIAASIRKRILARVVSVRVGRGRVVEPLPATGQILVTEGLSPAGAIVDPLQAAGGVVRKLLSLDFQPVESALDVTESPAAPELAPADAPVPASVTGDPIVATPPEPALQNVGNASQTWRVTSGGSGVLRFSRADAAGADSVVVNASRKGVDELIDRTIDSPAAQTREFGYDLFKALIPAAFTPNVRSVGELTLAVDPASADIPWEIVRDFVNPHALPLSVSTGLVRRVVLPPGGSRTRRYPTGAQRAALVVGDPYVASGPFVSVPRAAAEASMVAQLLRAQYYDVVELTGRDASRLSVVPQLFSRPWSIVHLAVQGVFARDTNSGNEVRGLVLGDGDLLTVDELSQLRYAPEFVFLNFCRTTGARSRLPYHKLAAHFGAHLVDLGARAVVVAGWPVDDDAADEFTRAFYHDAVDGLPFSEAVRNARADTCSRHPQTATWGAYQCYGNPPFARFRTRSAAAT